MNWAAEELKKAQLGDKRLNRRLVKIVEDLGSQPEASIPRTFTQHSRGQWCVAVGCAARGAVRIHRRLVRQGVEANSQLIRAMFLPQLG